MYRMDYGMHLGPSVTVNPVSALCVNAYFRYAPTFAMSMTKNNGSWDMDMVMLRCLLPEQRFRIKPYR